MEFPKWVRAAIGTFAFIGILAGMFFLSISFDIDRSEVGEAVVVSLLMASGFILAAGVIGATLGVIVAWVVCEPKEQQEPATEDGDIQALLSVLVTALVVGALSFVYLITQTTLFD